MLLLGDVNTKVRRSGTKYCDEMAVFLDELWFSGDAGDYQVFSPAETSGFALYGRRVLEWTGEGFVRSLKFNTITEALAFMYDMLTQSEEES